MKISKSILACALIVTVLVLLIASCQKMDDSFLVEQDPVSLAKCIETLINNTI